MIDGRICFESNHNRWRIVRRVDREVAVVPVPVPCRRCRRGRCRAGGAGAVPAVPVPCRCHAGGAGAMPVPVPAVPVPCWRCRCRAVPGARDSGGRPADSAARLPPSRVHENPVDAAPTLARSRESGGRRPDARACTRIRWTPHRPRRSRVHATPVDGARACTRIRWTPPPTTALACAHECGGRRGCHTVDGGAAGVPRAHVGARSPELLTGAAGAAWTPARAPCTVAGRGRRGLGCCRCRDVVAAQVSRGGARGPTRRAVRPRGTRGVHGARPGIHAPRPTAPTNPGAARMLNAAHVVKFFFRRGC